ARGSRLFLHFPHTGEGAERRSALRSYVWHLGEGAACFVRNTLASRRSTGGVFHPGTVLRGPGLKGLRPPMSRMALAILVPGPVPANLRRPFVVRADGNPGPTGTCCLRHSGAGATTAPPTRRL